MAPKATFSHPIDRDLSHLNPRMQQRMDEVLAILDQDPDLSCFRVFEGYRSPMRQEQLYRQQPPVTKAKAWRSVHQFGFAVDLVPFIDGEWEWDRPKLYQRLHAILDGHLVFPIEWDKGHAELPGWQNHLIEFLNYDM